MADRWDGRSRSRSRSRERRRGRSGDGRSPRDRRRRDSRERDEHRRRRSPSRSRSRERYARGTRERSPPRRNLSPPRRGHGGRRSSSVSPPGRRRAGSRSPPPRGRPRWEPAGQDPRGPPPSDLPPDVGSIHRARVVSVRPFGAFVELPGYRKQALVHHTQVSDDVRFGREDDDEMKVKALEFFVPRGEQVWIKVLEVRQEGPGPQGIKVAASMRAVSQEDGRDLDPDNALAAAGRGGGPGGPGGGGGGRDSDEPPELYSIHRAAVQQVRPFGVFVKLDGYRKYGLVHFSQISDHLSFSREDPDDVKVKEISEILSVGDPVFVKVVDITADDRGPKIGCSIKHVSQSDGTDLDPANSKYRPRGDGGGGGGQGQQPIGSSAGVAQDGAVDWGHLKADVVQYGAGAQQYDILAADSDDDERGGRGGPPRPPPGAPAAPGSGGGGDAPFKITSIEQALAIVEAGPQARREKRKKHKKEKKGRKEKKSKKEKRSKHRKEKRSRRSSGSDSSSGSGSD